MSAALLVYTKLSECLPPAATHDQSLFQNDSSLSIARQSSCISDSVPASCPTRDNAIDSDLCVRFKYQQGYFYVTIAV